MRITFNTHVKTADRERVGTVTKFRGEKLIYLCTVSVY